MAEIKFICPSCGAPLLADEKSKKITCKYCGNTYLEAEFRDDIINSRYKKEVEEAARLRNNCDFEEAHDILDNLLSEDSKNPEIYFQLLLLDYGITYVDENEKIRQVPIFNYIKKDSMQKNGFYKLLFESIGENEIKQNSYKTKIEALESLRKKVYDTFSKDEPYHVFISFKKSDIENPTLRTRDLEIARRLYEKFTKEFKLKVFFSEESLKDVGGTEYEPHIFSALYSSSVFLLICASPDKPEYIRSPWIKSEWQRFAKRYDEELDNKLALIPVFSNGYSEAYLPRQLQRFEGYELNEEFYENMRKIFSRVLVGSKRSQFQTVNIGTKVSKLKTNKETITLRGFSGQKERELVDFEKTDFEVALANMKARTKSDFVRAYEKLERVTKTNPYNYEANLAKLKCDFHISFEESLVNASLSGIKKNQYSRISKDLMDTLSVASDEDKERIIEAFVIILMNFFEKNPKEFVNMLDSTDDLLLTTVSAVDKEKMLEIIQRFEDSFRKRFQIYRRDNVAQASSDWKKSRIIYDGCVKKLFRKYYSNYEEEGAKLIISILSFVSRKAIIAKDHSYADKLMKEILDINEYDIDTIWAKFLNSTTKSLAPYGESTISELTLYLTDSNFVTFPLSDELPDMEANKSNLYYCIVKMITGGAKLNLTNEKSPFYVIFQAAMRMFNQKKKISLSKKIIKAFTEMAESANASKKEINYILMRSANRLLVEKQYDEAVKYFNEALTSDSKNDEAHWGLMKCEAKCPTNYSLLFYKKDLSELNSFRSVITEFKKNHPDSPNNPYLDFYSALRKIKASKRKDVIKAFKYFDTKLLDEDDPIDDPPAIILSLLQSGKLVEQMKEEQDAQKAAKSSGKTKTKGGAATARRGSPLITVLSFVIFFISYFAIIASILIFHPFIALGVMVVLLVINKAINQFCPLVIKNNFLTWLVRFVCFFGFLAAVFFGRVWFVKEVLNNGTDTLYLFSTTASGVNFFVVNCIVLGCLAVSSILSVICTMSDNGIEKIKYSTVFNRFLSGALVQFGIYCVYLLVGMVAPILLIISAAVAYFMAIVHSFNLDLMEVNFLLKIY